MRLDEIKLAIAMARNGFNLTKLAQKSGVSRQTLSMIKAGKRCRVDIAVKIAKALNCDVRELLEDSPSYYDEQQALKDALEADISELTEDLS